MKRVLAVIFLGAALAWPAVTAQLRGPAASMSKRAPASRYQAGREVTLEGTVASIVTDPSMGLPAGVHLMLNTSAGAVDAHLGNLALRGANAVVVNTGDKVKVVGVMTGVAGRGVLLVRTLQDGLSFYRIRSDRGFLVRRFATGPLGAAKAKG